MKKLDDLKKQKLSESNLSKSVGKKAAPPPSPQPSCESMSDEDLSFSFDGQSYPSYQEMVDAKRLRNAKVLEKSGLLNAKQAVVDAMVAVSSRGKKDSDQIKVVHWLKRARNDNDDDVVPIKVAHRNNNNNVVKNNLGEKGCADSVEKGGPDVGPSVAAAASTETYRKQYGPNVEDTLVSYC